MLADNTSQIQQSYEQKLEEVMMAFGQNVRQMLDENSQRVERQRTQVNQDLPPQSLYSTFQSNSSNINQMNNI